MGRPSRMLIAIDSHDWDSISRVRDGRTAVLVGDGTLDVSEGT